MGDRPTVRSIGSGLRVVTEPMAGVRSVALGVWIGVGSRYETSPQSGISHFLEHLLFKGTDRYSAEEIAQFFDGLGGEINAATGRDYTVVYMRVLDEALEQASPVLADMLTRPSFHDLDQEREVVLEEIAMYEDDPGDLVHDMLAAAVFPDQPLGRPVIGTREVVGSVPQADVAAYHRHHYRPANMVVSAAGNLDDDAITRFSELLVGNAAEAPLEGISRAESGSPTLSLMVKPTEQVHLCLGGPGLSRTDTRRHAQSVLDTVLGGLMSSRLFQEVREKRGLAYSVGSYALGYADTGQVAVHLGTREDNLRTACEVIGNELNRLGDEPVPAAELRRAKDHIKGRLVLSTESPGTRMNRIGRAVVTDGELLTIDEVIERIEAVTADDIRDLADEFWRPERMSAAVIGPNEAAIHEGLGAFAPALVG
ncbi:MAG: insulinase family protein [Thermoleophilia bacterium]|nr:insulinase family protein [Thermoleophilia bacterium]